MRFVVQGLLLRWSLKVAPMFREWSPQARMLLRATIMEMVVVALMSEMMEERCHDLPS